MKKKLFFAFFLVFFYSFSCYGQEAKLQRQRELKKQALAEVQKELIETNLQGAAYTNILKYVNIELEQVMDEYTQRIMLYEKLYQEYNDSTTNVNNFANKILANNITQKNLGVTLNSVNDVKYLFSKGKIDAFRKANLYLIIDKAMENAREAMMADMKRELLLINAKISLGHKVKWVELQSVLTNIGYTPQQADELLEESGFYKFNFD